MGKIIVVCVRMMIILVLILTMAGVSSSASSWSSSWSSWSLSSSSSTLAAVTSASTQTSSMDRDHDYIISDFPAIYTIAVPSQVWHDHRMELQKDLFRHLDVLHVDCRPTTIDTTTAAASSEAVMISDNDSNNVLVQLGAEEGEGEVQQQEQVQPEEQACYWQTLIGSEDEYRKVRDMVAATRSSLSTSTSLLLTSSSRAVITFQYNPMLTGKWVAPRIEIQRRHHQKEVDERNGTEEEEKEEEAIDTTTKTTTTDDGTDPNRKRQHQHHPILHGRRRRNVVEQNWQPQDTSDYTTISTTLDCYLDYDGTMGWIQDLVISEISIYSHGLLQIQLMDIGDSYFKTVDNNNGNGGLGEDIFALTITLKDQIDDEEDDDANTTASTTTSTTISNSTNTTKAPFFLMTSTHPREYAPPELVRRWISYLVQQVNDPTSERHYQYKSFLQHTIIHWVPYLNPDGRKLAETTQPFRRKNLDGDWDTSSVFCDDDSYGVDLNRNMPFFWGDDQGSSSDPCVDDSRGPYGGSEPESQAFIQYSHQVFSSQQRQHSFETWLATNGNNNNNNNTSNNNNNNNNNHNNNNGSSNTDTTESTTTWPGYNESTTHGVFCDVHSFGNFYIYPWGNSNVKTPNDASLRAGMGKLEHLTSLQSTGPGNNFYGDLASGATDDYSYGVLGAFGMTWEVGTDFEESCDIFEGNLDKHFRAFEYLASIAPLPFALSKGPDVLVDSIIISPSILEYGNDLTLVLEASDGAMQADGKASASQQTVVEIRVYATHPLVDPSSARPIWSWNDTDDEFMIVTGSGNSNSSAMVQTTLPWDEVYKKLGPSRNLDEPHVLYIQAMDEDGSWGPVVAVPLLVVDDSAGTLKEPSSGPTVIVPSGPTTTTTTTSTAAPLTAPTTAPTTTPVTVSTGGPVAASVQSTPLSSSGGPTGGNDAGDGTDMTSSGGFPGGFSMVTNWSVMTVLLTMTMTLMMTTLALLV